MKNVLFFLINQNSRSIFFFSSKGSLSREQALELAANAEARLAQLGIRVGQNLTHRWNVHDVLLKTIRIVPISTNYLFYEILHFSLNFKIFSSRLSIAPLPKNSNNACTKSTPTLNSVNTLPIPLRTLKIAFILVVSACPNLKMAIAFGKWIARPTTLDKMNFKIKIKKHIRKVTVVQYYSVKKR